MQALYEGWVGLRTSKLGRMDHACHGNHTGLAALPGEMSQMVLKCLLLFTHVLTRIVCYGCWEGGGSKNPPARWLLTGKVTGRQNDRYLLLVGLGLFVLLMVHAEVRLKEMLHFREDFTVVRIHDQGVGRLHLIHQCVVNS